MPVQHQPNANKLECAMGYLQIKRHMAEEHLQHLSESTRQQAAVCRNNSDSVRRLKTEQKAIGHWGLGPQMKE